MLKIVGSIRNGATPKVMVLFNKALYGNYLAYASTVYSSTSLSNQESLEVTHRQCQRIATGCSKTTPINTLAALSNEEPLKLKRYQTTKKRISLHFRRKDVIYHQLMQLDKENRMNEKYYTFLEKVYLDNYEEVRKIYGSWHAQGVQVDVRHHIEGMPINKKNMSTETMKQMGLEYIRNEYCLWRKVFTDASRTNQGCGIGVFEEENDIRISIKLDQQTSIMTAELLAIRCALKEIIRLEPVRTVILTDSQSSCWLLESHTELKDWDELTGEICQDLMATRTVLQWIPSHVGIYGNEQADLLAKQGVESDAILVNKLCWNDAVCNYKNQLADVTNQWYKELALQNNKGRKFYDLFENFPKKPWYWHSKLDGRQIRTLNRVISGHDFSKYWLSKMKIVESDICELCDQPETTTHSLFECIKYTHVRNHFDWELYKSIPQLLHPNNGNIRQDELKNILKFLQMAHLEV